MISKTPKPPKIILPKKFVVVVRPVKKVVNVIVVGVL